MSLAEAQAPARPAAIWDPAEARLSCLAVRDETADTKTFSLAPTDGSRVKFHAGQNLTLEWAMPDGETLHRTFTVASAPTCATHVEITMKAQPSGYATRDMHARLRPGVSVRAYGPGGRFGLAYAPAEKVLLLGAGSGATPMMSMLRWVRDRAYDTDIAYLHAARTPADILFADELEAIDTALPNVSVSVIVADVPSGQSWFGPRGQLDRRWLTTLVPDARDRETFCCGPAPFMTAMRRALAASGQDASRYHEESFGPAPAAPPPLAGASEAMSARLARSNRTVSLDPSKPILSSLRAAGVALPSGCKSGICGTCRVGKSAGEVAMSHQGGLSVEQEAKGEILACCSYPLGDVVLDL